MKTSADAQQLIITLGKDIDKVNNPTATIELPLSFDMHIDKSTGFSRKTFDLNVTKCKDKQVLQKVQLVVPAQKLAHKLGNGSFIYHETVMNNVYSINGECHYETYFSAYNQYTSDGSGGSNTLTEGVGLPEELKPQLNITAKESGVLIGLNSKGELGSVTALGADKITYKTQGSGSTQTTVGAEFSNLNASGLVATSYTAQLLPGKEVNTYQSSSKARHNSDKVGNPYKNLTENTAYYTNGVVKGEVSKRSVISGKAFVDANGDGQFNEGEVLLKDVQVVLTKEGDPDFRKEVKTSEDGRYEFSDLETGNYLVTFAVPDEYKPAAAQGENNKTVTNNVNIDKNGSKEVSNSRYVDADSTPVITITNTQTGRNLSKDSMAIWEIKVANEGKNKGKMPASVIKLHLGEHLTNLLWGSIPEGVKVIAGDMMEIPELKHGESKTFKAYATAEKDNTKVNLTVTGTKAKGTPASECAANAQQSIDHFCAALDHTTATEPKHPEHTAESCAKDFPSNPINNMMNPLDLTEPSDGKGGSEGNPGDNGKPEGSGENGGSNSNPGTNPGTNLGTNPGKDSGTGEGENPGNNTDPSTKIESGSETNAVNLNLVVPKKESDKQPAENMSEISAKSEANSSTNGQKVKKTKTVSARVDLQKSGTITDKAGGKTQKSGKLQSQKGNSPRLAQTGTSSGMMLMAAALLMLAGVIAIKSRQRLQTGD